MVTIIIAIEIFAIVMVITTSKHIYDEELTIITELLTVSLAFIALMTNYLSIMKKRRREDNEEEIEFYSRRLKQAIIPEEIK